MAAARDIAGSADSTPEIAAPSGSLCTGDLVHRLGEIAAAAPFSDAQWNRTLQEAAMALREIEEGASDMHEAFDNLALLLRRAARKIDPRDPLRTECVAYLKHIGQAGNPLRGVTAAEDAEPLPASDIADMRDAGVLASTAIKALEDIERDASGALNNAFEEEAPDVVANLQARAAKALKALSSVNNQTQERAAIDADSSTD